MGIKENADDIVKEFNNQGKKGNTTHLLRLCVIGLSLVSFYTTASGMRDFIFQGNDKIAYAASAAVQGILLAMSMNLPGYLKNIWKAGQTSETETKSIKTFWQGVGKIILCIFAFALTLVTLFCSSCFSYVYIANVIHQDSWDADSTLLVQQTYRTELYNALDYAHVYRIRMEEEIGEEILLLEKQTEIIESKMTTDVDWDNERETYVSGSATVASYMSTVIVAMENALSDKSSAEERVLAVTAVEDARDNIADRMESVQKNINTISENITNYTNRIRELTNQIKNATADTDTSSLTESINNYSQVIFKITEQQTNLQEEYLQLDNALMRLPYYESLLGLNSSTSSISIRTELIRLQEEFFYQEPDVEEMIRIATDIFDNLRSALHTYNSESEAGEFTNTTLLLQMNQLIQNLKDYAETKKIESNLEKLVGVLNKLNTDSLKMVESNTEMESQITQPTDQDDITDGSIENQDNTNSENEDIEDSSTDAGNIGTENVLTEDEGLLQENVDNDDILNNAESTGNYLENAENENSDDMFPSISQEENASSTTDTEWKKVWSTRFENLKAQISALPVYGENIKPSDGISGILSETQKSILQGYNRNNSVKALDDIIRRYLSEHNAIYQGIIYLESPYRHLAVFALVLALSFDLSGFVVFYRRIFPVFGVRIP